MRYQGLWQRMKLPTVLGTTQNHVLLRICVTDVVQIRRQRVVWLMRLPSWGRSQNRVQDVHQPSGYLRIRSLLSSVDLRHLDFNRQ